MGNLLLLLQITLRLSFGLEILRNYAKFPFRGQKIPEISNLHYRFRRIDEKTLKETYKRDFRDLQLMARALDVMQG